MLNLGVLLVFYFLFFKLGMFYFYLEEKTYKRAKF